MNVSRVIFLIMLGVPEAVDRVVIRQSGDEQQSRRLKGGERGLAAC